MKTVREAFNDFLKGLELTDNERAAASDQHTHMRTQLQKRLDVKDNFLSGSYARKTAVRPLNDIDVFLVLEETHALHRGCEPRAVLDVIKGTLEAIYPGKTARIQARSVNIEFSGTEIAYDVVPAFMDVRDDDVYWIPDCDAPAWIPTNPRRHMEQSTAANEMANKKLKPLLKAVKHANHIHGRVARSFHLEVLSWKILTDDPGAYVDGLERLLVGLRDRILEPCPDPAGLGGDIRPSAARLKQARAWLSEMASLAEKAAELTQQGNTGEAHAKLREIFGDLWPEAGVSRKGGGTAAMVGGGSVDDSRSRFG